MVTDLELKQVYLSGWSTTQMAKRYNLSKQTISRRLKAQGVKLRGVGGTCGGTPKLAKWGEVAELYRKGMSLDALGRRIGCGKTTVSRNLRKMGVKIRGRGGPNKVVRKLRDERTRKIIDLYYVHGYSTEMVRRVVGVSVNTVRRHLHRVGMPFRNHRYLSPARKRGVVV